MGVFVRRATVGIVLAVVMALAGTGAAQAAWSGVGSLDSGRYNHTATLLNDGRVLVTGGNNNGPLDSAELYDPATNRWSKAAPMNYARHGHAAVPLPSGKVLVAGGFAPAADPASPSGHTSTAEIYDPAANTWTKAASMSTGRLQPTMTVLNDGRVLVAGGSGDIETDQGLLRAVPLASAEIYDPEKNEWTDVAPMWVPRALHTATLLHSGKVLVAGGFDGATGELSSAELYDPVTNEWEATEPLAEARDSATATALPNGEVLVAGGDGGARGTLGSAEVYQPESGTWRATASMAGARQTAAAALLKDGTVLVAGGEDTFGQPLMNTERYDPAANTWTDAGAMAVARKQESLTALDDGLALVVGGNPGGLSDGLAGVERFSTVTTTLTAADFESRLIGTPSGVVSSVLTNTGSTPLVVTGVSVVGPDAGDFAIASESCLAAPVLPGESCQIGLRFTPTAAGARSATLTVADNTAAGTSTASLSAIGQQPAPAVAATSPAGDAPTGASAAAEGARQAGRTGTGGSASGSRSRSAHGRAARTTCTVKTTRRHGRRGTTVTCRMSWPTRQAVALNARLMHGATVLARTRATARAGHAALTLRPARRLRSGRYTVMIARRDGTMVLRQKIRVS